MQYIVILLFCIIPKYFFISGKCGVAIMKECQYDVYGIYLY